MLAFLQRFRIGFGHLYLRLGNGQIDRRHLAQRVQRLAKVLGIAGGDENQILRPHIFFGHAQDVGLAYCGDGFLVLENEILRIAVIFVRKHAGEGLRARIEVEHEAVFHGLLGGFQLLVGYFSGAHAIDLIFDRLEGLGSRE